MGVVRVQRKRVKGWRMPLNTVYVGRGSKWGNPFRVEEFGCERSVELFREYVVDFESVVVEELRGKNLACWCRLDVVCHADVLLEIANF